MGAVAGYIVEMKHFSPRPAEISIGRRLFYDKLLINIEKKQAFVCGDMRMSRGSIAANVRNFGLVIGLMTILLPWPQSAQAQLTQNEPAGSTKLGECDFSSSKNCGVFQGYYGGGFLSNLPDAPYSPTGVYYDQLAPGASTGNGYGLALTGPQNRELYVSFYWKMGPGYIGGATGTKLFFMRGAGATPECNTNGFFGISGTDGIDQRNYPYYMFFGMNTGSLVGKNKGNPTCNDWTQGDACPPNASKVPLYENVWYHVEAYVRASSSIGANDGIIRWWIDGNLVGDVTNYNYGCGNVNEFLFDHTWDGSTAWECPGTGHRLNRDCSRDLRMYLDHVYVSAPNCPNGCPKTGNIVNISPIPQPPPVPPAAGCPPIPDMKIRTPQNSTPAINLGKPCKNGYEIFGLPPICSLSKGAYDASRDTWDLTSGDASGLTLSCPNFCGKMEFTVIPKNDP